MLSGDFVIGTFDDVGPALGVDDLLALLLRCGFLFSSHLWLIGGKRGFAACSTLV